MGLRVKIAGKWKKAVASVNRLLGAQIFHSAVPRKGGMNLDFLAFGFDAQILFPLSDSFRWLDYPFHTFFPSTSNAVDLSSIVNCHHPIIIYRSCSSFGQWFYVTRAISRIKFTEVRVHNIYYRKGNGQKKVYNGRRKQWKPKKEKEKLKKTPFVKKNSHRKYCP